MARLFQRKYRLTLDTFQIEGLAIDFKVKKSIGRAANTCTLSVTNLSRDTRARLSELGRGTRVKLEVGYENEDLHVLFNGGSRTIDVRHEKTDYILDIEARDRGDNILQKRVNRSYPPGTEVRTVIRDLVDALEIGRGNLSELEGVGLEGVGRTFPEGTVLSGQASRELDEILRSMGLRWSVQNGVLQLQRRGRPLSAQAVNLSPETGLVGSPALDTSRRRSGIVNAVAFIMPDLVPGRKVSLQSELYSGGYEIRQVEYSGSWRATDWYANLTLRPY